MSSRAGRKRLAAQRKSGIRIVTAEPERILSPNQVARSQPHRMRLYEDTCHDSRAMTSFGQLNLIGAIDNELYAVGVRFAATVNRHRELTWRDADTKCKKVERKGQLGTAKQSVPSAIARLGLAGVRTFAEIKDAPQCRADYDNAMGRLATASKQARAITLWVVVEGGRVPAKGFKPLMAGLRALKGGDDGRA